MHAGKRSNRITIATMLVAALLALSWSAAGQAGAAPPAPGEAARTGLPRAPLGAPLPGGSSPRLAPAQTIDAVLTVCQAGSPTCDYGTIQEAVDAAGAGDTIKVAAGTYSGIQQRPVPPGYLNPPASGVITQVVFLSRTLTLQGGYTTSNGFADPPDPQAYPTTIDAQGQGRALVIAGAISPTIAGLRFTGGDASGLGGYSGVNWEDHDTGGGVCVIEATALLSDNVILQNIANSSGGSGSGGGMYLLDSDATLLHNTFLTNTANTRFGGGIYTLYYNGAITDNDFSGNTARWGGAIFLEFSPAALSANNFSGNSCTMSGGALNVHTSDAEIRGNTISSNHADEAGGAMRLYDSAATLYGNIISDNTASQWGGAIHLWSSPATLEGNWIQGNATAGTSGALEFWLSNATLVNNVITDNEAGSSGTAMYIAWNSSPQLLHNTIARNRGTGGSDGSGIYVDYYLVASNVTLVNTILVSHTVGVYVATDNTATLEATLWGSGAWGNGTDWAGTGTIVTGTINLWEEPAFVDPDAGDYHIGPSSGAIDAGVDAMIYTDIDGESRPCNGAYDIGADESWLALRVTKEAYPDPVAMGEELTYTLRVTNTGASTIHATITDILPAQVTPGGVFTWTAQITPGGLWTTTVPVTVVPGYAGPLTNVVLVTTEEGATGAYTHTATVLDEPIAGLAAWNDSPTLLGEPTTLSATVAAGSNVAFTWAFGDGTFGSGAVVTHTYPGVETYTALVTASNTAGQLATTSTVLIADAPIAGLAAWNDSPTPLGEPTTLSATVAAGSNVVFTWAFGDGTFGSGAVVTHTYPEAETYIALVTASNTAGQLATSSTVLIADVPIAGLAAWNDSPTLLGDPTTLSATVAAGSNVAFTWAFGDGTFGSGAVVTHTYAAVGPYAALVTASNAAGQLATTSTVLIADVPIAGLAAWNDSPTPLGEPTTLSATVAAGSNVVFTWAFGDGAFGSGAVVTHTYTAALTYTVVVTASNGVSLVTATTTATITPFYYVYLPLILRNW